MDDERITVRGRLGQDPERRTTPKGEVVKFTVAHNERVQQPDGRWADGATTWYDVDAWGRLGANAAASLRKGQPVVVHGVLQAREWTTHDGEARRSITLRARAVGHDLNLGVSAFNSTTGPSAPVAGQIPLAPQPPALMPAQPAPQTQPQMQTPAQPATQALAPVREPAPAGWHSGYATEEETPF